MVPFRVLYVDMNSFFASVEQQLDLSLRDRPVAITALDSEAGACVRGSSSGPRGTGFTSSSTSPWPMCSTGMPS